MGFRISRLRYLAGRTEFTPALYAVPVLTASAFAQQWRTKGCYLQRGECFIFLVEFLKSLSPFGGFGGQIASG